jgi:hypothetical protein
MRNMIKRKYFKAISLMLIAAFLNLEVAWAYTEIAPGRETLSGQSVFQPEMMTAEADKYRGTIFADVKLLSSVHAISEYLLGSLSSEGSRVPLEYLEHVMKNELGKEFLRGISLENVVSIEHLRAERAEDLKEALEAIGLTGNMPDGGVVIIPFKDQENRKHLIQVALKSEVSPAELAGYELPPVSGKYLIKVLSEEYGAGFSYPEDQKGPAPGYDGADRSTADDAVSEGHKEDKGVTADSLSAPEAGKGLSAGSLEGRGKPGRRPGSIMYSRIRFYLWMFVLAFMAIPVIAQKESPDGAATAVVDKSNVQKTEEFPHIPLSEFREADRKKVEQLKTGPTWLWRIQAIEFIEEEPWRGWRFVPYLHESIFEDEDWRVSLRAAESLSLYKDKRSIPVLIQLLCGDDWIMRRGALRTIPKFGQQMVEPLVKELSNDVSIARKYAADALDALKWKPRTRDETIRYLRANYEWDSLAALGLEAVEYLVEILVEENPHIRKTALGLIVNMGEPAEEPLRKILETADEVIKPLVESALEQIQEETRKRIEAAEEAQQAAREAAEKERQALAETMETDPEDDKTLLADTEDKKDMPEAEVRSPLSRDMKILIGILGTLGVVTLAKSIIGRIDKARRAKRQSKKGPESSDADTDDKKSSDAGKIVPLIFLSLAFTAAIIKVHGGQEMLWAANILAEGDGLLGLSGMVLFLSAIRGMGGRTSSETPAEVLPLMPDRDMQRLTEILGRAIELSDSDMSDAVEELSGIFPGELDPGLGKFISFIAGQEVGIGPKEEKIDDKVLARALRIMQLVYLSRNPVRTDLNPVRYAWAGKANRVMYGLDTPATGENDVAEVWHGSTVIKNGKEDNPSRIKGTAITVGNVTLPEIHLRGLMEYIPGVLGGSHREKPFFIKFLCTRFADKVHMGFNFRMNSVSTDQFIGWLIRERKNSESIKDSLKNNISREEFDEYLELYEEWVLLQSNSKWLMSRGDAAVRGIVDKMAPYFKPSVNAHDLFGETSSARIDIVSVLNEIELKPGMTVLSPAGYPHAIFGLSHQTHPTRVITHEDGTKEYPKNEAWVVISVRDSEGKEHLISVEPQQTSNDTYSWGDFYTPIVWDSKAGAPAMRKNVTADDIRGFVENGLYTDRVTSPEDFIIEPVDITPEGAVNAKLESLIEETSPVWSSQYFVTHRIALGGKDDINKAHIKMMPVKGSYHELIVTKGNVAVKLAARPDIELSAGEYLFMPASLGEYTLESLEEAEVLKFFPKEASYDDIEGKTTGDKDDAAVEERLLRPFFELIETTINNRRTRSVDAANVLIDFLGSEKSSVAGGVPDRIDRDESTAGIMRSMNKVLALVNSRSVFFYKEHWSEKTDLPIAVREAATMVYENIDRVEADSIIASIIIMARKARREGTGLILGLETGWIPGNERGCLQHGAINPLIREIEGLGKVFRAMGLENVIIVHAEGDVLAEEILARADNEKLSEVIVLASVDTISSAKFDPIRSSRDNVKAFMAGVDPSALQEYYNSTAESFNRQMAIDIMKMLSMALELAAGNEAPNLPILLEYDRERRTVLFMPRPEPMEYDQLRHFYRMKRLALQAA